MLVEAIALVTVLSFAYATARLFVPKPPEKSTIHECSMMGHDYQPVYDEAAASQAVMHNLPNAGPFMHDAQIVKIAQANAQAVANAPRKRTYVHSVCRYCGLTIKRDA
jgi:hypothetical protein